MHKPWLEQYPPGVAEQIDNTQYTCLFDMFQEAVTKHANHTAYISIGKKSTYKELGEYASRFAAWLQDQGIRKGERVALMMPNILQYPICLFGALQAGCVVVNCNPLYTERELQHQLNDANCSAIVIIENFAHTLEKVLPNISSLNKILVTSVGDMIGVKGHIVNFVIRNIKKMVPAWYLPNPISLKEVLTTYKKTPTPVQLTHDDIAFLQYTGGTTGLAKGAILTHGNIVSNVLQADEWIKEEISPDEFIVTALPLYHIFALTANCLVFIRQGATNLLILNPRDIPGLIKEIGKYKFTAFTGVNTLFNAMLNNPEFSKLDFSSFRFTLGGGMAVQPVVADRWEEVTGCPLAQAYGLTETSPAVTINPLRQPIHESIGLPISSTVVDVRNNDDQSLPLNEVGEICVKGPQVMQGYWQNAQETAKVMTADGFFKTGDIGYMDEKGYVYLVDRKKDMIIVSGFNVYPNEVDAILCMNPKILEAAVVGVDNGAAGELVKAYVVRKDPSLTEEELIKFCRQHLTAYKVPKQVVFIDTLPKTNVGKILRRELKNL